MKNSIAFASRWLSVRNRSARCIRRAEAVMTYMVAVTATAIIARATNTSNNVNFRFYISGRKNETFLN